MRPHRSIVTLRLPRRPLLLAGRIRRWAQLPPIERVMRRLAPAAAPALHAQVHLHLARMTGHRSTLLRTQFVHVPGRALPAPARADALRERTVLQGHAVRERSERRELILRPAAAPLPPARITRVEQRQVFPRVQLTLVRREAAAPARDATPAALASSVRRQAAGLPGLAPSAAAPAPLVLPPQELARVTDHVLGTLDRRVLSWQERTGRH